MTGKGDAISRRGLLRGLAEKAAEPAPSADKPAEDPGACTAFSSEGFRFDTLPILDTYPWELFEDEAKRLGIDVARVGRTRAIEMIIAAAYAVGKDDGGAA